jgi:penicillin-insensitive murein DD-endopeptidase
VVSSADVRTRLAILVLFLSARSALADPSWESMSTPKEGPPRSIGGYSAGCIQGAVELPEHGPGFRVARPQRRRAFGHPLLVAFLRALAKDLADEKLGPLWVGDLAQARGGPAPSGHASHQTGLDVDLWFGSAAGTPPQPVSLVDLRTFELTHHFGLHVLQLLASAAASPEVDRIFVNPVLKRTLCEQSRGDRAWLRKIRPWFGHHEHFHVRLACPTDSPDCEPQDPLPPGDGCAELDWWLTPAAEAERAKQSGEYQKRVSGKPQLPEKCRDLLQ